MAPRPVTLIFITFHTNLHLGPGRSFEPQGLLDGIVTYFKALLSGTNGII